MPNRLSNRLFWVTHLLVAFLLPGVYVFLVSRGGDRDLPIYLFWAWELLTLLLLGWVVGLLGWRLWQRRWGRAVGLALLVGVDVLVLCGYLFLVGVSGMAAGPN